MPMCQRNHFQVKVPSVAVNFKIVWLINTVTRLRENNTDVMSGIPVAVLVKCWEKNTDVGKQEGNLYSCPRCAYKSQAFYTGGGSQCLNCRTAVVLSR